MRPLDAICEVSKLMKLYYDYSIKNSNEIDKKLKEISPLTDEREEVNEVVEKFVKSGTLSGINVAEEIERNIQSVVIVVQKKDLKSFTEKKYSLTSEDLGNRVVVIGGEKIPFSNEIKLAKQRSANSLGTGFFYKDDKKKKYVISAAHVIFPPFINLNLSEIRFIKGFSVRQEDSKKGEKHLFDRIITIPKDQVFKPAQPNLIPGVDFELSSYGEDWAKIEVIPEDGREFSSDHVFLLDKHIEIDKNIDLDIEGQEINQTPVYGIGHGFGLPLKLSPCGKIIEDRKDDFFECSIDFFSGNSGSPVFSSKSHKLLGILIRGKKDIYIEHDKAIPGVLKEPVLAGEVCQKITFINKKKVKKTPVEPNEESPVTPQAKGRFPKKFLPYIHLKKIGDTYELDIWFLNKHQTVEFAAYPEKTGQITYINCFLNETTSKNELQKRKYILIKPENLESEETIEVRILEKSTGIYHVVDFGFDSIIKNNSITDKTQLFWTMCIPKENYFNMREDIIGIGLGYFKEKEKLFITSKITNLSVEDFNENSITFDGEQDSELKLINKRSDDKDIMLSIKLKDLFFSKPTSVGGINRKPTSVGGVNRKPTSVGGVNRKPTRFISLQ